MTQRQRVVPIVVVVGHRHILRVVEMAAVLLLDVVLVMAAEAEDNKEVPLGRQEQPTSELVVALAFRFQNWS